MPTENFMFPSGKRGYHTPLHDPFGSSLHRLNRYRNVVKLKPYRCFPNISTAVAKELMKRTFRDGLKECVQFVCKFTKNWTINIDALTKRICIYCLRKSFNHVDHDGNRELRLNIVTGDSRTMEVKLLAKFLNWEANHFYGLLLLIKERKP